MSARVFTETQSPVPSQRIELIRAITHVIHIGTLTRNSLHLRAIIDNSPFYGWLEWSTSALYCTSCQTNLWSDPRLEIVQKLCVDVVATLYEIFHLRTDVSFNLQLFQVRCTNLDGVLSEEVADQHLLNVWFLAEARADFWLLVLGSDVKVTRYIWLTKAECLNGVHYCFLFSF